MIGNLVYMCIEIAIGLFGYKKLRLSNNARKNLFWATVVAVMFMLFEVQLISLYFSFPIK